MASLRATAALSLLIALGGCSLLDRGAHDATGLVRRSIDPDARGPTIAYPSNWRFRYIYAKCLPRSCPIAELTLAGLDATWSYDGRGPYSKSWNELPGRSTDGAGRSGKLLVETRDKPISGGVLIAVDCPFREIAVVLGSIRMKDFPSRWFSLDACVGGPDHTRLTREVVAMVKSMRNVP